MEPKWFSAELESLFHALADLNPDERISYFADHATDPSLRTRVEALLACDRTSCDEFTSLVRRQINSTLEPEEGYCEEASCGPYRLLRLLGRGGMGEVWLAERIDGLLKRPVALKLPFAGYHASQFAQRLDRERDILATLEHPGIARLYDAGFMERGQPFLALEFVEGLDLTTYCNRHELPVATRLRLFIQVLNAVQYAHSRLVIHRDLKPSNILVTAQGEVKLLDFGIAKLMVDGNASETVLTQSQGRALTLGFASPEQITGGPVTTSSDVFSLGLILAELIAGGRVFLPKRDTPSALEDAILHDEPRRPSQSVTGDQQARERSSSIRRLRRTLRGDLDVIVFKAVQKRPERRYPTVDALRADVERYLSGDAVLARRESTLYRVGKFTRRHKWAVFATAAIFIALVGGLGAALWQANVAKKEARTAAAVEEFTEGIFLANSRDNPDPVQAQHTTARQLLDIGARKVSTSLADAPEAKLKMLQVLGQLYKDLSMEDEGVVLLKARLSAARKLYGSTSPKIVPAMIDLGVCLHASRSVNERENLLLEAKSILDRHRDFTSETRGRLLSTLAENYTSTDMVKAAALARESIEIFRRWPPSPDFTTALYTAGVAYLHATQYADAEQTLKEAIHLSRHFYGDPNSDLPRDYAYLAETQASLMQYHAAENSYYQAYQYAKKLGGDFDVDTLETELRLGSFLVLTSRSKEALPYLRKAMVDCVHARGADDPFYTPQTQLEYGMGLAANGRPEEALEQISLAVQNRRAHRPGTAYLAQMLEDQAGVLTQLGLVAQAKQALREAEAIHNSARLKANDNYLTPRIRLALAEHRISEAMSLVEKNYGALLPHSPASMALFRNMSARAEIALQTEDSQAAIRMSRQLVERLSDPQFFPFFRVSRLRGLTTEGLGLMLGGRPQPALVLLRQVTEGETALFSATSPELGAAEAILARDYLTLGDRVRAQALYRSAKVRLSAHKQLSEQYTLPLRQLEMALAQSR